jgi:hypothetical protein
MYSTEQSMTPLPTQSVRPRALPIFLAGLSVRLAGVGLIWLGDGHPGVVRKGMVAVGVVLSVGGIAVLKFLLYGGLRRRNG